MTQDAIDLLIGDHRRVESLFATLEAGGPGGAVDGEALAAAVRELSVHDAIERLQLYPVVRDKVPASGEPLAERSLDAHVEVSRLLAEIEKTTQQADPDRLAGLVGELITSVRAHVAEEEDTVFPQLRRVMDDGDLAELGERLAAARDKAPTHPHPHTPTSKIGAKLAGAAAAQIDRIRDRT